MADIHHVLLCVSGCVQAQVTPRLIHNILNNPKVGPFELNVVATVPALQFFDRGEAEKVLGKSIFVDHSDSTPEFEVPHINLAQWANVVLVYPASANTIAKCANGFSDSLVANVVMAATCPVYFAPAMNEAMLANRAVQRNLKLLEENGFHLVPTEPTKVKVQATGEIHEKEYCSERMALQVLQEQVFSQGGQDT